MAAAREEPRGRARLLVVQSEREAPAGWFGDALREDGCELTVATPYDGSRLPGLDGFDGLLVLGGSVDAWDDDAAPWLPDTRELVRRGEREQVPVLGICLGHQVAAHALGGTPGRHPAGRTVSIEPVGWLPSAAADPLFGAAACARRALHWNRDVVLEPPEGAVVTARSRDGAVQAARLGRSVWGVQSHPEVDARILGDWPDLEPDSIGERELAAMRALVDDLGQQEALLQREWRPFVSAFAQLVRRGVGVR
jgi:GMP synthase (glutamine-hydrolysing)